MIMEPSEVRYLANNYAGVRIDGSNATIIGTKPGEFIADRNNIPRVDGSRRLAIHDHALYMDQSGI